ncbi:testis-specific chromodomain y 1 [Fusarium sporotrichioides]|uniref:Testis-specific chromodomain y 1 n=1 Tax=Fusarium sporotrichioides TaxID=5514 RepID=A0A395SIS3_FUSSP|nr:testis-specific chromodomain y 1 [Fusarium sporotrichioides]
MPAPKRTPTVFYARDKSPLEESDDPLESIEADEPPLVNIESDITGYGRNDEESVTPPLDDDMGNAAPAKRTLSPEEEGPVEPLKRKPGRPLKRRRRADVDEDAPPRRPQRVASVAPSVDKEDFEPAKTSAKRGRGRPPKKKKSVTILVPRASTPTKRRSGRVLDKPKTTDAESEIEWEVEKILDSGIDGPTGVHLYLVKWKGFSNKENTWEPKKNLGNCHKLLREFEEKH